MYLTLLPWAARLAGAWTLINGTIHSTAVLLQDKPYDRHLLYLLMVGSILFFSGFMEILSSWGLKNKEWRSVVLGNGGAVFVLVLCLTLLPIFKAIGMIIIHSLLLILIVVSIFVKNQP